MSGPVDIMRFMSVPDAQPLTDGITNLIGGILTKKLQTKALGGDEQALLDLQRRDPSAAQGVGQIFDRRQQEQESTAKSQQEQQSKIQEMRGRIATGYANAKDKGGFLQGALQSLSQYGNDPIAAEMIQDMQEIVGVYGQSPEQIDRFMQAEAARFGSADRSQQVNTQFGAQQTVKDAKGNLYFATQKRNPSTGQVESALSPIGNAPEQPIGEIQITGQYGLTADENVNQKGAETSANVNAKANAEQRQKILQQGVAAREMIPRTEKLLELNGLINTGKTAKAQKFFGDLFGVTNPDLGQFNAMAGKLVLDNIRMLGANPTEGERTFLQTITPSLEQGGKVNEALINDILNIQRAQVKRAKWFAQNPGRTIEEYFLETDEGDFQSSYDVNENQSQDIGGGVKFLGFE